MGSIDVPISKSWWIALRALSDKQKARAIGEHTKVARRRQEKRAKQQQKKRKR